MDHEESPVPHERLPVLAPFKFGGSLQRFKGFIVGVEKKGRVPSFAVADYVTVGVYAVAHQTRIGSQSHGFLACSLQPVGRRFVFAQVELRDFRVFLATLMESFHGHFAVERNIPGAQLAERVEDIEGFAVLGEIGIAPENRGRDVSQRMQ